MDTRSCADCGTPTLPESRWRRADEVERAIWLHAGIRRMPGRGLCRSCYGRHRAAGTLGDFERRNHHAAELVEEWHHLADPLRPLGRECRRLAPQLGVSPVRLENAVRAAGVTSRHAGGWGERVREAA